MNKLENTLYLEIFITRTNMNINKYNTYISPPDFLFFLYTSLFQAKEYIKKIFSVQYDKMIQM